MRWIGCLEISVRKYRYSLRNNPEQHSSHSGIDFVVHSLMLIKANSGILMVLWINPLQEQGIILVKDVQQMPKGVVSSFLCSLNYSDMFRLPNVIFRGLHFHFHKLLQFCLRFG
jgi:hypothetical protein